MTQPVIIGIGGTKFVKDATTKMLTLNSVDTNGVFSLHDDSNTDYSVPVGKKFVILQICSSGGAIKPAGGGQIYETESNISYNPVTDVAGTVVYRNYSSSSFYTSLSTFYQPIAKAETYIEIPASNFIVITNTGTSSTTRGHGYIITGVECDV
jgi:hypothetical protein